MRCQLRFLSFLAFVFFGLYLLPQYRCLVAENEAPKLPEYQSADTRSELKLVGDEARLHDQIAVKHIIRNTSAGKVWVRKQWFVEEQITVEDKDQQQVAPLRDAVLYRKAYSTGGSLSQLNIPPGEEAEFKIDLQKMFDFSRSGKYRVKVKTYVGGPSQKKDEMNYREDTLEIVVEERIPWEARLFEKARLAKSEELVKQLRLKRDEEKRLQFPDTANPAHALRVAKSVLSVKQDKLVQFQPVDVQFSAENISQIDLEIKYHPEIPAFYFQLSYLPTPQTALPVQRTSLALQSREELFKRVAAGDQSVANATITLAPGKTWAGTCPLSLYYDLSRPGHYQVSLSLDVKGESTYLIATTEFEILPAPEPSDK